MVRTIALVPLLLVAGCSSSRSQESAPEGRRGELTDNGPVEQSPFAGISEAVAVVHPTKGNKVEGIVRFTDVPGGCRVVADFSNLKENAQHAFHVHEYGDCTGADGKSAGGHWNPENHPHAGPDAELKHAGDLGNVQTDGKGRAHVERVVLGISVAGRNAVLGRAVVVHASPDDFTTQDPPGNAGARIGCGVIGVAKPAGK